MRAARENSYSQATFALRQKTERMRKMNTTAQNTVTLVETLYDLYNSHQSDPAWLDKSLAFFAEDCEVIDIPSGATSRGPGGLCARSKQLYRLRRIRRRSAACSGLRSGSTGGSASRIGLRVEQQIPYYTSLYSMFPKTSSIHDT